MFMWENIIPCLVVIVSYQVPRATYLYNRLNSRSDHFNNKVNWLSWHWVKWLWVK